LDTRDDTAWEESSNDLGAEHDTEKDGGAHDQDARGNHLIERGIGGDSNTTFIRRNNSTFLDAGLFTDLSSDL
jgi:hypothetical protein